jgi:hypothetical protein
VTSEEATPARIRIRTETGSNYEIVRGERGMWWRRISATSASGPLRGSGPWPLFRWPAVRLGSSVVLVGPPYVQGTAARVVVTSRVVDVKVAREAEGR